MSDTVVGKAGDRAGFVTLVEPIGKPGEQGEVWLAKNTNEERLLYAVKISKSPTSAKEYAQFQKEFEALVSFRHPNIVRVHASGNSMLRGETKISYPFYVMDYLGLKVMPLKALCDCPAEKRTLICLRALKDAAAALAHVHEGEGSHGDIKSSNILICNHDKDDFSVVLIDFGFCRLGGANVASDHKEQPQKESSAPRTHSPKTRAHYDVYKLARTIRDLLRTCARPEDIAEGVRAAWPIDYAAYSHLMKFLDDWASTELNSKPDTAELSEFYDELSKLTRTYSLSPDVKGTLRYLSIPEIATAARLRPAFEAIKIPPRQLVLYTDRIKELITTPQVGALRYVRQLGFTHLVYPGAQGTRFEHSLGVYDLACQFVIRMAGHAAFRKTCANEHDVLKFLVAALLHDVGHFPMAHQLEEFEIAAFAQTHQGRVRNLVRGGHVRRGQVLLEELRQLLKRLFNFSDPDIEDIKWLVFTDPTKAGHERSASLNFLRTLVNGPVDLDKLDYIERDANHCGVPYGNYLDVERIKETMKILDVDGCPTLAFDWRGVGSIEQMATARHQLYAYVYWHRAVRSATVMFKHAFYLFQELLQEQQALERLFYESGSDDRLMGAMLDITSSILNTRSEEEGVAQKAKAVLELLNSVSGRERILYKAVLQADRRGDAHIKYGADSYREQREKAKLIYDKLLKQAFFEPGAAELGEHNVLIDCRVDSWPRYDKIQILKENSKLDDLGEIAPSIRQLWQNFREQACKIRVFVNPRVLKERYRAKAGRSGVADAIEKALDAP